MAEVLSVYDLGGRLYASSGGWVMLSVPNSLGRGVFDALSVTGLELPTQYEGGYNAHISVIRPEELRDIGGPEKITERGHQFGYTITGLKSTTPSGWADVSKVWFLTVKSPDLESLRKSYGLSATPNMGQFEFHITCAIRRRNILRANTLSKAAAASVIARLRDAAPLAWGAGFRTCKYSPGTDTVYIHEDGLTPELGRLGGIFGKYASKIKLADSPADIPEDCLPVCGPNLQVVNGCVRAIRRFDAGECVIPKAASKLDSFEKRSVFDVVPEIHHMHVSDTPNTRIVEDPNGIRLVSTVTIYPGDVIRRPKLAFAPGLGEKRPPIIIYNGRPIESSASGALGVRVARWLNSRLK